MSNAKTYIVSISAEELLEAMKKIAREKMIASGIATESEIVGFYGGFLLQGMSIGVIVQPSDNPYR